MYSVLNITCSNVQWLANLFPNTFFYCFREILTKDLSLQSKFTVVNRFKRILFSVKNIVLKIENKMSIALDRIDLIS